MHSPRRRWLAILMMAVTINLGLAERREALATRMVPLTVEQLTRAAGLVVHGRVESLEVTRDADGRVFTRVALAVMEVWKGALAGEAGRCELVLGGGTLGERVVRTAGQAEYALGDEVVAFLARNPAGEWVTLGLSQGRFRVEAEAGGEGPWVSNVFWGEPRTGDRGAKVSVIRSPLRRPMSLRELKRRTQEADQ